MIQIVRAISSKFWFHRGILQNAPEFVFKTAPEFLAGLGDFCDSTNAYLQEKILTLTEADKVAFKNIWESCENVEELKKVVDQLQAEYHLYTNISVVIDFLIIALNVVTIMNTWSLLVSAGVSKANARNYLNENMADWERMVDQILIWHELTATQRINLFAKVTRTRETLNNKLNEIKLEVAKLEADKKFKWLLTGINVWALVSSLSLYSPMFPYMSGVQQTCAVVGTTGLGIATVCQVFQIVQEHNCIRELEYCGNLLNTQLDRLNVDGLEFL